MIKVVTLDSLKEAYRIAEDAGKLVKDYTIEEHAGWTIKYASGYPYSIRPNALTIEIRAINLLNKLHRENS